MPTPTEFWFWKMRDDFGRVRKSPCRFREADALARDPTAVRVPGSCEVRNCPDGRDDWDNFSAKCGHPTDPLGHIRHGGPRA